MVRQSASTPPEVWAGPIGQWKQLTNLKAEAKPAWGEMHSVHWMNGTARVQGWLMLPKDFTPDKTYPLVVNVHGGPSSACVSQWDTHGMGLQSAMGYFALCPNPRGSYGQGETFTQGNVKDFGGGDFRDILAGIDARSKQYPIDHKRVGIRGHSYGGYMSMWAETQTHRFAAAVAGAGLSDGLSYYGLNDIDEWMIPFFGASIDDDPAGYAKSDPMHFVKAVKTPTVRCQWNNRWNGGTRSAHCTWRPSWWSIPTRAMCSSRLPIHGIMRCALCNGSRSGSRKQSKFVPRLVRLPLDLRPAKFTYPASKFCVVHVRGEGI
jgi:dipeptidyl aminopeptidase/acylaminoacyl peptidase